jgi:hypothetical protein
VSAPCKVRDETRTPEEMAWLKANREALFAHLQRRYGVDCGVSQGQLQRLTQLYETRPV